MIYFITCNLDIFEVLMGKNTFEKSLIYVFTFNVLNVNLLMYCIDKSNC